MGMQIALWAGNGPHEGTEEAYQAVLSNPPDETIGVLDLIDDLKGAFAGLRETGSIVLSNAFPGRMAVTRGLIQIYLPWDQVASTGRRIEGVASNRGFGIYVPDAPMLGCTSTDPDWEVMESRALQQMRQAFELGHSIPDPEGGRLRRGDS